MLEEAAQVQGQQLGVSGSCGADQQGLPGETGVGLGKDLSGSHVAQNGAVAPGVMILDGDTPGEHHPEPVGVGTGLQNHFPPGVPAASCVQSGQKKLDFLRGGALKQGSGG